MRSREREGMREEGMRKKEREGMSEEGMRKGEREREWGRRGVY